MMQAMQQELVMRLTTSPLPIRSVYFGGGTPSLIDENYLASFLNILHQKNNILPNAEITLEANPDDLEMSKLKT